MRLLLVNDLYGPTSAAGIAVRMARGLARRGHQVAFLATTQRAGGARHFADGGVAVHVEETPAYNLRWRAFRSLDNPAGVAAMARVVEQHRPDLVHVHNLHMHLSYAALRAARRGSAKVLLHVHDAMPVCHQKLFCHLDDRIDPGETVVYRNGPVKCALCVRARFNPLRNATIRRAVARDVDRLLAVSPEMARLLADNGMGPATVVYNGVPMKADTVDDDRLQALAARWGLSGRRVVLHGGRLDRLKGGLELVRALERVRRAEPRAMLLTVGEALPGFREEMNALAERLGMTDALVHVGWLDETDLAVAYALADVVAAPSLCFESFNLLILEAMRASRPVVASCWGGPADVVLDGVTGFLVNPQQIGVLADRIGRLLGDAALAARMGAAGRRRAQEHFALETSLDRVEQVYRELMA